MKIPITLNNSKIVLDANPNDTLLDVLRREELLSAKCGCGKGMCGACTVVLDGKPVPSCIMPIAVVRDGTVMTLEYFLKSDDYSDIIKGFNKAGIHLCGFCNAGKIFAAWDILNTTTRPNRAEILEQVRSLSACCTNSDLLVNGIFYAFDYKVQRMGAQKNAK
ncbi:MAG: 2Fe-2S iron-sulfur cluster binding domain-containing protein [Treponema sp.]|nr:2Fe-2S iron-sulfur cluster binding domain-containing protein [Treponema sp.]